MSTQAQFIVDTNGKKSGVIISVKQYQKMMDDLHELTLLAERRAEKPVSFEEMRNRYIRHRRDAYRSM